MAAPSNESQGLKIAVAAFVTLSVILIVTSYFLYSSYSQSEAQLAARSSELSTAKRALDEAVSQTNELIKQLGARATEFDAAKSEITGHFKKLDERLMGVSTAVNTAVAKAQSTGASAPELEDIKNKIQQLIQSYRTEPNKSYISALDRFAELFESMSMLSTELSLNFLESRKTLEVVNRVNKAAHDIHAKSASDSKADLNKEHDSHDSQRAALLSKVDQLQTDNDKKASEIANLRAQAKQTEDELTRKIELANAIIREQRDQLSKTDVTLDKPDGRITFVDYESGEVQVDINKRMGAHPQMKMTVFDRGAPGIPTDRPKGSIELLSVGDRVSIAKILKTNNTIDPLRVGDIVYSAAWSANEPTKFALIGKIDVNRDGKDDRAELKRMIEEAGGRVDFELPPPDLGKESGKLTARIDWYVTDERAPLRESYKQPSETTIADQTNFEKRKGEVIKEARLNGIRPMPIERLLTYLGYDFAAPVIGRAEAVNPEALRQLVAPRRRPQGAATKGEASKAATPKNAAETNGETGQETEPK